MKRIGFILLAIMAIAFLVPALSMAQSTQTVDITGNVYNGAIAVNGVKVQIYNWDGKNMGTSPDATTMTQTINGRQGSFEFKSVPYDSSKTYQYVIQAQSDLGTAHALVYILPPDNAHPAPEVLEPINLDMKMWDWKTDLTGMVQTGNMGQDAVPIPGATVTIYSRDNGTVGTTPLATATTDSTGQFEIKNVLSYGQYEAAVAAVVNNNHYSDTVDFTAYQQETNILSTMTHVIIVTATPTTTPSGGSNGGNGFMGMPGFEVVLALVALGGVALYMRKK